MDKSTRPRVRKQKILFFLLGICLLSFAGFGYPLEGYAQEAIRLPEAQRMYGFAAFVSAYQHAMGGEIEKALNKLERAIKLDPYMVDYYLLKGYCLYTLGKYEEAAKNLGFYLEVRDKDTFARSFMEDIRKKERYVREALAKGVQINEIILSDIFNIWTKLGISPIRKFFPYMPTKPASLGDELVFADEIKGKLYIYRKALETLKWKKLYSGFVGEGIVRVLPIGDMEYVLCFRGGRIKKVKLDKKKVKDVYVKDLPAGALSDAVYVGENVMAVSDFVLGKIYFLDVSSGEELFSWKPEGGLGFEPVSLDSYGPLLAIADRRSGCIYLFNAKEKKKVKRFSISCKPRSVAFLSSSEIAVLAESGALYSVPIGDGRQVRKIADKAFPEAWFLFRLDGKVFITDTRLFRGAWLKPVVSEGYLVLKNPSRNQDYWEFDAKMLSPFCECNRDEVILEGVIEGSFAKISIVKKESKGKPMFFRGERMRLDDKYLELLGEKGEDLVIESKALPGDLPGLIRLGCFALANGIRFFILMEDELPGVYQVRLAELTGGRLLFSKKEVDGIVYCRSDLTLKVSPSDLPSVPGMGDDSGLLILGRFGPTKVEGRLPFWSTFLSF
ncbi:MAG: tetratricopeptide repeat protein [Thermovirga sp.]|nr:tetratricopeptide repeat protein [Thermovirga sp.]